MKYLSFVLIVLIAFLHFGSTARTKDAWPKDFNVTKLSMWPKMKQYFQTVPKNETEEININVLIQRKVVGVRFANGSLSINKKNRFRPPTVILVDPKRYIRALSIGYAILTCMTTAVLVYFCGKGMWKAAVTVHVKDVHDTNTPPRQCPVTLTLFMNAKKEGKTAVVKSAQGKKGSLQDNNNKKSK